MNAYSVSYIDDAAENLGEYLDHMVNDLGFEIDQAMDWFIYSGVGLQFGKGNTKFITGMSGGEMARYVLHELTGEWREDPISENLERSREYWTGWILAQVQWKKNLSFKFLTKNGLSASEVRKAYILHEADPEKFMMVAEQKMSKMEEENITALKRLRKYAKLTQKELSDASGVALRMIQLYEQGQNDLKKAQFETIFRLSLVLQCDPEELV